MKKKALDTILKNFNFKNRPHHYYFAYRALPYELWEAPEDLFLHLLDRDNLALLKNFWTGLP
jgi:hypothetical protein